MSERWGGGVKNDAGQTPDILSTFLRDDSRRLLPWPPGGQSPLQCGTTGRLGLAMASELWTTCSCRQHLLRESKTPWRGKHFLHIQRPPTPVTKGGFCHLGCKAPQNWCGTKMEERRAAGGSPNLAGPVCKPRKFLWYSLRADTRGKMGGTVGRRTHQR